MKDSTLFIMIFSGIWGLVGVIFLCIGLMLLKNQKKKMINCTSKTYGKVIDLVRRSSNYGSSGHSSSWHPVFEYEIGELKYIKESNIGKSQSNYAVGQDVEVYYNPQDPHEFYIKGEGLQRTLGIIFTCVGIVCIFVAILVAVLVWHFKPEFHTTHTHN